MGETWKCPVCYGEYGCGHHHSEDECVEEANCKQGGHQGLHCDCAKLIEQYSRENVRLQHRLWRIQQVLTPHV